MECCIGSVIFFGLVAFLTIFVAYGRELGKEQERERKYEKARRKELEKEKDTVGGDIENKRRKLDSIRPLLQAVREVSYLQIKTSFSHLYAACCM